MQGWRDARLEIVTADANVDINATLVYMKLPKSKLNYADWDALR